jgi:hypothetical protein
VAAWNGLEAGSYRDLFADNGSAGIMPINATSLSLLTITPDGQSEHSQ